MAETKVSWRKVWRVLVLAFQWFFFLVFLGWIWRFASAIARALIE